MNWERLVQLNASYWLAVVDLFRTPLEVWASSAGPTAQELDALQREVWEEWGKQPPPLNEVIFG
jgi:hypothetical protein